jgi:hypothetical protein
MKGLTASPSKWERRMEMALAVDLLAGTTTYNTIADTGAQFRHIMNIARNMIGCQQSRRESSNGDTPTS